MNRNRKPAPVAPPVPASEPAPVAPVAVEPVPVLELEPAPQPMRMVARRQIEHRLAPPDYEKAEQRLARKRAMEAVVQCFDRLRPNLVALTINSPVEAFESVAAVLDALARDTRACAPRKAL